MVENRNIEPKLLEMAEKFPVIAITGPRQSGKTTLAKKLFADHAYLVWLGVQAWRTTLENPETREFAISDPKGFLAQFTEGVIIDEVQHVPELFSYIQGIVDETGDTGKFILTGSQNFLLMEKVSQSLAGRIYVYHLLPFSLSEIGENKISNDLNRLMFTGGYPRIYHRQISPSAIRPCNAGFQSSRQVSSCSDCSLGIATSTSGPCVRPNSISTTRGCFAIFWESLWPINCQGILLTDICLRIL